MPTKCRSSFDPKAFLAKVGEGRSINRYRKDQIVFSQGDPADAVFYIERGEVKFTVVSEQGKEAVVAILGTNQFFGEGCLAGQAQRIATVATMTDSVIVRLEKVAILRVIHQEPAFSEIFIAHLLARPSASRQTSSISCSIPEEKRLARLLPLLANFGKDDEKTGADPRENQPGDACGDDRNDPVPGEFFHEQISKTGSY